MQNIFVVDLEATCREDMAAWDMETIEIGCCYVADGVVLDCFRSFVRPVVNPLLSEFCSSLTGIRQADVNSAPLFPVAAELLRQFVASHRQPGSTWASWGNYDRKQLDNDSARHGMNNPFSGIEHRNLKREFAKARKIKEVGMARALAMVGLPLDGTHHRALDDARNVARLLPWAGQAMPHRH